MTKKTLNLLEGLQILDLTDEKAVFCSKLLADLGAEVIKIERPGGDSSRWLGPFWKNSPHPERSLSFWYNNSSKLGITLNLEVKEGQEIFRQLVNKTDVIIETFPPEYAKKLKLDYQSLVEINQRLILASITGFGQTGPYRQYKSCDIVASATGGQMYICGAPDTPPLKPYGEQSYFVASLFAAIGILVALRERHQSGKGQHIDISLQEAVAATLGHVFTRYFYDGAVSQRQGYYDRDGSFCLLPCQDGYIFLTIDREWDILVNLLDNEGMAEDLKDNRWQDSQYRRQHFDHVVEMLTRWTKRHTRAQLFLLGQLMRLPWAPVNSLPEMVNSIQLSERNYFVPVEHPELASSEGQGKRRPSRPLPNKGGSLGGPPLPGGGPHPPNPISVEGREGREVGDKLLRYHYPGVPYVMTGKYMMRRAPLIGEHNTQIYQERLGLSSEDLKRLKANKVI